MKKFLTLTLVAFVVLGTFLSCTVDIPSTPVAEETDYSAGVGRSSVIPELAREVDKEVEYKVVTPYFVIYPEEGKRYVVINSLQEFNTYFHYAAYMGAPRPLNQVDFIDNVVVAIVEPGEYKITDYTIEEMELSDDTLEFSYKSVKRDTPNTGYRFCHILLVKKASYKSVTFIENDRQKAVRPVL